MNTKYIAYRLMRLASEVSDIELDDAVDHLKSIGIPDNLINRDGLRKELEEEEDFTIDKLIQMIDDKDFGFIGISARVSGNRVIMELVDAKFGIDFGDREDLRRYVDNEHDAMEYAEKVWKPLIENNFKGMRVVLPKNTSVWYDWSDDQFDLMSSESD